jgi:aerobic-type carbon monoxide dehydrogenase small subunit (CoxS/CutS family)
MPRFALTVNEESVTVDAASDTPLLYVLAGDLGLRGPRFGCGLAQCGSCSVLLNGKETRSCVLPVSAVAGQRITTLEGLPRYYTLKRKLPDSPNLHPLQQAMIEEQAVQCGYCVNGMIIKGAELLETVPNPTEEQIRQHMNGHLCRCGTYPRITKAILRAAQVMAAERA